VVEHEHAHCLGDGSARVADFREARPQRTDGWRDFVRNVHERDAYKAGGEPRWSTPAARSMSLPTSICPVTARGMLRPGIGISRALSNRPERAHLASRWRRERSGTWQEAGIRKAETDTLCT